MREGRNKRQEPAPPAATEEEGGQASAHFRDRRRQGEDKRAGKRKLRRRTTPKHRAAADRQARRRELAAQGLSIVPVPYNREHLAELLFRHGFIEQHEAECLRALGAAAAQLLALIKKF